MRGKSGRVWWGLHARQAQDPLGKALNICFDMYSAKSEAKRTIDAIINMLFFSFAGVFKYFYVIFKNGFSEQKSWEEFLL
jgi:hypothetical protein